MIYLSLRTWSFTLSLPLVDTAFTASIFFETDKCKLDDFCYIIAMYVYIVYFMIIVITVLYAIVDKDLNYGVLMPAL